MFWQKVITLFVLLFFCVEVYEPSSNFVREGVYTRKTHSEVQRSRRVFSTKSASMRATPPQEKVFCENLGDGVQPEKILISHSCAGVSAFLADLSPDQLAEPIHIAPFSHSELSFRPLIPPPLHWTA